MATHTMFDGRLQIYRRPGGRNWQCAARVGHERFRSTTGEQDLDRAKDVAEEWYLDLRGKLRRGAAEPRTFHDAPAPSKPKARTFKHAADDYLREVKVLAANVRSPIYVELLELRMKRHLLPYFGETPLDEINKGMVQRYRVARTEESLAKRGTPPARSTMMQEIVHLRQVLKHAEGLGWIPFVPNLSTPYMTQGKKGRRAWFSPEEYKQLYTATGNRIKDGQRPGWKSKYQDLHDFVLIMANTGLRPDEALALEFRDVAVEEDAATGQTILVIDVRGKTGVGYCKSMPNAVFPFQRLRARREKEKKAKPRTEANAEGKARRTNVRGVQPEGAKLRPTDKVFPAFHRDLFNAILVEEGLKFDRDGRRRTANSLRHTYISMRLMEGANIHQIANNCRTSVQMIEDHYAAHIKDRIDVAAINVMRPQRVRKAAKRPPQSHARMVSDDGGDEAR